jgi:hypothetical protein
MVTRINQAGYAMVMFWINAVKIASKDIETRTNAFRGGGLFA